MAPESFQLLESSLYMAVYVLLLAIIMACCCPVKLAYCQRALLVCWQASLEAESLSRSLLLECL